MTPVTREFKFAAPHVCTACRGALTPWAFNAGRCEDCDTAVPQAAMNEHARQYGAPVATPTPLAPQTRSAGHSYATRLTALRRAGLKGVSEAELQEFARSSLSVGECIDRLFDRIAERASRHMTTRDVDDYAKVLRALGAQVTSDNVAEGARRLGLNVAARTATEQRSGYDGEALRALQALGCEVR